jgi:hypothetical protein
MRRRVHLELVPEALLPTSFCPVLNHYSVGFFIAFFYFLCIVIFLYFYLCFVSYYLLAMLWFDLEEEIVVGGRPLASLWFFVVPALQPSFHCDGCFTYIGLFTEFLCILHCLVRPWNRLGLLMILFESLAITIACCSLFGPFGSDSIFVLIFALLITIWVCYLRAHLIFVFKISHFFFRSDQK